MTLEKKNLSYLGILLTEKVLFLQLGQQSRRGTNFADTRLIPKSSLKILCTELHVTPDLSTTSSMVRRRSSRIIL